MTARMRGARSASKTLKRLFSKADVLGISTNKLAEQSDIHSNLVRAYRKGQVEPGIMKVEQMVESLGYKLILMPLESEK